MLKNFARVKTIRRFRLAQQNRCVSGKPVQRAVKKWMEIYLALINNGRTND